MSTLLKLSTPEGVGWANNLTSFMDCLIYCQDGILVSSQVQLAAASSWIKEILQDVGDSEENRIKTLILPFCTSKLMKLVLDLICGHSITPKEADINELVDVFSMLGCIGNIIKEPSKSECILPDSRNILEHDATDKDETDLNIDADSQLQVLVHQLEIDRSIDSVLQQIQEIQHNCKQRNEESAKTVTDSFTFIPDIGLKQEVSRQVYKEEIDSDNFIVSDDQFSDYEGASHTYKKPRKSAFDVESFDEQLLNLGECSSSRGGCVVDCGLCDKSIAVPQLKSVKARINHFKTNHFNKCKKRLKEEDQDPIKRAKNEKVEDDVDALLEVYNMHLQAKNQESEKSQKLGRKMAELPPLSTIQSFLEALGGAKVINGGSKIKCGQCCKTLRINPERPIMGNIRYFERTHLVRCQVKLSISGKPTELISENYLPGRTSNSRVLKTIVLFDNETASIVNKLMNQMEDVPDVPVKRKPGRPRKDKENYQHVKKEDDKLDSDEECNDKSVSIGGGRREYYISKRKQCLAAAKICFMCKAVFETETEILEHYSSQHSDVENPFYCLACQEYFKSYTELLSHLETDHNYKESYTCIFCDKDGFISQNKLNRHVFEKHPNEETIYHCSMCSKGFSSFNALKAHQKTHEPDPNSETKILDKKDRMSAMIEAFTCRFCGETIMYGKDLDAHIRRHHQEEDGDKSYLCKICVNSQKYYTIFYYYQNHLREHGIYLEDICRFCKQTDLNRAKFNDHFKTEHPHHLPYDCPWPNCNKMFKKKQLQTEHITLHRVQDGDISDDMLHTCEECSKVFYTKKKYQLHLKIQHDGKGLNIPEWNKKPRRFSCTICSKSFSNKSLLQGHIRKHENNPCFMCDHCGKAFYRKDRLAVHTRAVHLGEKKFQCEVCYKKFMDNYKLRRHMKTHVSGRGQAAAVVQQANLEQHQEVTVETADNVTVEGVTVEGMTAAHLTAREIAEGDTVTTAHLTADGEAVTTTHLTAEGEAVAIVEVPHLRYQLSHNNEILRKIVSEGSEESVTIQQISNNSTILHIAPPAPVAKRSQAYIKFEDGGEAVDDQNPVDFTQGSEPRYILSTTHFIPTT